MSTLEEPVEIRQEDGERDRTCMGRRVTGLLGRVERFERRKGKSFSKTYGGRKERFFKRD